MLWLLRAPGQGGFGYSAFSWHLGRADVLRGPHSRVWRLLHIGWGNGNGMATRTQRPPGFCTCSKLQGSPEQPDRKQAPV